MNNVIKRYWRQGKMVQIEDLRGMAFQAEDEAHTFQIYGKDANGDPLALTGTVGAVFLRADNTDVAITGTVADGVASITLTEECYDMPGRFGLTVFLTSDGQTVAIYAAVGSVKRTNTGNVSPGTSENVSDLIDAINAAIQDLEEAIEDIPEDYSDLENDVDNLKSQIDDINAGEIVCPPSGMSIAQGTVNASGITYKANRICVSDLILVKKGWKVNFSAGTNTTQILIGTYSLNKAYITETSWMGDGYSHSITQDCYIAILFRKNSLNANISDSEYDATTSIVVPWKNEVNGIETIVDGMRTATSGDVGKALKAKTVNNGKVTEWEFGETGVTADSAFSSSSENPVQNKVISEAFGTFNKVSVEASKKEYGLYTSTPKLQAESGYYSYFFKASDGEHFYINAENTPIFAVIGFVADLDLDNLPGTVFYDEIIFRDNSGTRTSYDFINTNNYKTLVFYAGSSRNLETVTIQKNGTEYIPFTEILDENKLDKNQGAQNSDKLLKVGTSGTIECDATIPTKVTELDSAVFGSGFVVLPVTYENKWIKTNNTTVDITDIKTSSSGCDCYVIPCVPGDEFVVNGTGGSEARLWAFVSSDGTNLAHSAETVTVEDVHLTAPGGTAYIVINEYTNASQYMKMHSNISGFVKIAQGAEHSGTPAIVDTEGNITSTWDTFYALAYDADYSWYNWYSLTYDQLLAQVYEPLRTAMPYYITREVIGRDQSDTYDIYAYTFEPERYEQVIYLQAGVHPRETFGYITLARIMQKIATAKSTDENAAYLRYNCKIVVVPVVNVWGVMKPVNQRADENSANVNLNTDVINLTQAENIAVTTFFSALNTATPVSFAFDLHTTVNYNYGDYMATFWSACDNRNIGLQTLWTLARKNCLKRSEAYLTAKELQPTELNILYAGNSRAYTTYAYWWRTLGISGSTVEHADYVWSTSKHDAAVAERALENYAVQIINHARQKFVKTYGGQTSQEWD